MKFRVLAFAAVVVPFVTGCAEEGADGLEAAYPVGVTAPPRSAQASVATDQAATAPPQVPSPLPETDRYVDGVAEGPERTESAAAQNLPAPDSRDVTIGADVEAQDDQYADADPSALTDFRPALDPYGTWVDDATYGTAWVPSASVVGPDFTPYQTAGHWVYDDDYVWVSDYDWGWAPFHYGRWVYAGPVGWEWIPGRRYAGAWVSWRYGWGDWGYVGWAPLAPTWCWRGRSAVGIGFVPRAPYAFVATADLFQRGVGARVVTGERVGAIAGHTRPWVPASPGGVGRVAARPAVGGPPPSTLQIAPSAVAGGAMNRGVLQARAYARPSTALAYGASAPVASRGRSMAAANVGVGGSLATANVGVSRPAPVPYSVRAPISGPAYSAGIARPMAPAYGPSAPPHFGGRLGGGFTGVPAAGPTRALPQTAARPYFGTPSASVAAPSYHVGGGSPGFYGAPSFRSAPGIAPSSGFHGGGSTGGGFQGGGGTAFHGGSGFAGGGGFHGGGGSHGGGGRGGGHR